jgi:hypothetical protein
MKQKKQKKQRKRTNEDIRWQEVKEQVFKRDKGCCRLLRIVSARDFLILQKNARGALKLLDPAHVFAVGSHPELCYEIDNVVVLNRFSHECLDSCKDPITGERITFEERELWWEKILGRISYSLLKNKLIGAYMEEKKHTEKIVVNGKVVSYEELQEITKDKTKRLVEVSPNEWKTLQKLQE